MEKRRAAVRAAALSLVLGAGAALACELPGGPAQTIRSPTHSVVYRAAPRLGEHFAVEFAVCPAPEGVRVDAWMPAHRHGMNYVPAVKALGGGRYRAEGLLFHMPGEWEFVFVLRAHGATQRLVRGLRVE
ncbi:MAG TPA: FixH family protein [Burkholderiales bacterium]|nr:FixH family protein [Burkholderiales bacterium]